MRRLPTILADVQRTHSSAPRPPLGTARSRQGNAVALPLPATPRRCRGRYRHPSHRLARFAVIAECDDQRATPRPIRLAIVVEHQSARLACFTAIPSDRRFATHPRADRVGLSTAPSRSHRGHACACRARYASTGAVRPKPGSLAVPQCLRLASTSYASLGHPVLRTDP